MKTNIPGGGSPTNKTARKPSDQEQVTAFIDKLESPLRDMVQNIRGIILNTAPEIGERIKWNHPSFYYTGDLKPFDPKEYKRDIAVFNLFKDRVMLVFPTGARVADSTGLLEGTFTDGRRTVLFKDLADVDAKGVTLQTVVRAWLDQVEN
ncbi:DUF1801 domain-containing protein [Larkinella sp. VNQ87]|uniref:DUF1801 domain-containing protein n=1 Tax=Larkinella sp. VNQ87 TaxID=3400921 RepID=UPI003C03BB55